MGESTLRPGLFDDLGALRLLERVAAIANRSSTLTDAVRETLDEVCAFIDWPVGHAYLLRSGEPDELRSLRVWHLEDPDRFEAMRAVTEALVLRKGIGLPGRVLASGKPAWIEDVTTDQNFPRAHSGRAIEVRSGFACPVIINNEIAAVLEFFHPEHQRENTQLLELMVHVGTQLGRVAERERATKALHDQVEYTAQLIDSAHDAFVSIDHLGRIIGWNGAAEDMFGWSREEVIGLPLASTIVPRSQREQHISGIARYIATGHGNILNRHIELTAVRRNGLEFPVDLVVWPVGTNGKTTFCAFIHDITDRHTLVTELKAADERARTSERRLSAAQEQARVGSWEWDVEHNIVMWSDQLYRNFGVDPHDFQPSFDRYMELVHPDDRARVASLVTECLDKMTAVEFDHRVIRGDGEERVHHCTGKVIVEAGRAIRMAGTNQDVTDRLRVENELRGALEHERATAVRLRELDERKSEFVSSVTHELRTPLTSIIGYLEFLLATGREITDEHKDMLDIIERNSQRLMLLIDDLLTQSRLQSGAFRSTVQPTPVQPIIDHAVQVMLPVSVERDIALDVEVKPDVGSVMGDADQIERLLLNLLSNAMKFTEDGSVRLEAYRERDDIVFRVIDTGIGIAPEEIGDLFRPFSRAQSAEHRAPGTGLGLAIVKTIADQHGGSVEVQSAINKGTTFTVRIPAAA